MKNYCLLLCFVAVFFLLAPEIAFAQAPWESGLQRIVDYLTGTTARLFAIIAIAIMGLGMLFNFLPGRWPLMAIMGITFIFGAATVVDLFAP